MIILYGTGEIHRGVVFEREQYHEDLIEKDIEVHAAPATRGQMRNFLSCIETGAKPEADIEEDHISTASCILANMSMTLERPLVYDHVNRIVVNDSEATALLARKYRGPWIHPNRNEFI